MNYGTMVRTTPGYYPSGGCSGDRGGSFGGFYSSKIGGDASSPKKKRKPKKARVNISIVNERIERGARKGMKC